MNCHFIESYEDEREVLRKIEELKTKGFSDDDMYIIARSNEQLTSIRIRTDVEYHAAEGKGMGRIGIFFKGGALPLNFSEMTDETRESAFYYLELLEGKILLFCNKKQYDPAFGRQTSSNEAEPPANLLVRQEVEWIEEERVFIDSMHYESSHPLRAEPIRKRPAPKRKKLRWPRSEK
ncbi:general stress protein [Planococcus sp. X10-3]|uniref:general stress protein n=1 Tax=Planococcus sp. X10-3 TaxID=3061240 RepID=UPI003BAE1581